MTKLTFAWWCHCRRRQALQLHREPCFITGSVWELSLNLGHRIFVLAYARHRFS